MKTLNDFHYNYIFKRRVDQLSNQIASLIPIGSSFLDVGCGNGNITSRISKLSSSKAEGLDVFLREDCKIPVSCFDGKQIPFADKSFDFCIFVDVLHHTENISQLIKEAMRVSKNGVIIKDHLVNGKLSYETLKLMDDVGNKRFGVNLPYNYYTYDNWMKTFSECNLKVDHWKTNLNLYPFPLNLLFDRKLHFISKLSRTI